MNAKNLSPIEIYGHALRIRGALSADPWNAIGVFDAIDRLGVELRFVDLPSAEGLYSREPGPFILVNPQRPHGRKAFTAAHELGHHVFGHGHCVDQVTGVSLGDPTAKPEECRADFFAASFLMPKLAVSNGFVTRGWSPTLCSPQQVYIVASWLGVGYETLIQQMRFTLGMLSEQRHKTLLRVQPKALREEITGLPLSGHLAVVDIAWTGRPVDIEVEDHALLPTGTKLEGNCVEPVKELGTGCLVRGIRPGIATARLNDKKWATQVRVSKAAFVGRSIYRYEEDADDE